MKIDLEKLSIEELTQLQKDVADAIREHERKKKREAIEELEAKARELGFASLSDVVGDQNVKKRGRRKVAPKYRHPENKSLEWSGRGRTPHWFRDALESGISKEDMRID